MHLKFGIDTFASFQNGNLIHIINNLLLHD